MNTPGKCPACKKGALTVFDRDASSITLTCSACNKITMAKTQFGKIVEVAVPGLAIASSSIAILEFLGVTDLEDLLDVLG